MNPWDARYSQEAFFYGTRPNDFLVSQVNKVPSNAKVLCLAEGEGRNAVYLAEQGHKVVAIDQSAVGLEKARSLAQQRNVSITTEVCDLDGYHLGDNQWDAVVSISAHTPPAIRKNIHGQLQQALKPGGIFILEAYRPEQIDMPGVGGPPAEALPLFMRLEELRAELQGLAFEIGREVERDIQEGEHHKGLSAVVQILAVKR
jgi:SAM-dependent methyltransferase